MTVPLVGVKRRRHVELVRLWWQARGAPGRYRDGPRVFAVFLGYPRSGHGLVSSLLDAHPDAAVAHELDALALVAAGFGRERILRLVEENARQFTAAGRRFSGYTYAVPGQWQGRVRELRVAGDKKASRTLRRVQRRPGLLATLGARMRAEVRVVHVVRDPRDTLGARHVRRPDTPPERLLRAQCGLYRAMAELRAGGGLPAVHDVALEELVADPRARLAELCRFLGLEPAPDYLDACAALVFPRPERLGHRFPWTGALRAELDRTIAAVPFLHPYRDPSPL